MKRHTSPPTEKGRSLLILSPDGRPLKTIKINGIVVAILLVCVVCGCFALFMPASFFRFHDEDGYKKIRLNEQNRLLQERIAQASATVGMLETQIESLEKKKKRVAELLGSGSKRPSSSAKNQKAYAERLVNDSERLLREISRWEAMCDEFLASIRNGNPFDTIPSCKPILGESAVTQEFGEFKDPFTGRMKWHYGIDYAAAPGTDVIATAGGVVLQAENDALWGKRIVIRHGRGIITKYAHLGSIAVRRGQTVKRGSVIGTIGSSGLVTGPHVHYEVWSGQHPVNPEKLFFPLTRTGM